MSTPIVDDVYTDEDIVRQQEYQIESLQKENKSLREQINSPPTDETELRLYEMTRELMSAHRRNRKLSNALQETKEHLQSLKGKVEQLSAPPNHYGVFLSENKERYRPIRNLPKKLTSHSLQLEFEPRLLQPDLGCQFPLRIRTSTRL